MPEIAAELRRRVEADQRVRQASGPDRLEQLIACDRDNATWLLEVVRRYGWPGIALVGERGGSDAWVLAQHADRAVTFQRECLDLLIEAADADDAPAWQVAYLTDRVLMHRGRAQRYGTQYRSRGGEWELLPIEDRAGLAARRVSLGLPPEPAPTPPPS